MEPTHQAFVSATLFEQGLGPVVVGRRRGPDRVEAGVFLLDVACLGAKDVWWREMTPWSFK